MVKEKMRTLLVLVLFVGVMLLGARRGNAVAAQWAETYGGIYTDGATSIQKTTDGGYIVAGYTNSFGTNSNDVWVLKLDGSGNVTWQKTYGGSYNDYKTANSIQQTADGGYIVAGYTRSFDLDVSDAWILKLDGGGNITWQKTYGGKGYEEANSIQQTDDDADGRGW